MKIAFIHYHLKTGGVTTVLRQQVEAVLGTCDVFVLTGAPRKSSFPCRVVHIPGLGYDRPDQNRLAPGDVAASIIKAINQKWKGGCDLVHVHNPTLAKNRNFLKILKALQNRKIKLFLQIHDFAEDGRPLAYFSEDEYVQDSHYGVINSRDYNILLESGLKKKGLHKISNTIKPFNLSPAGTIPEKFVLYPIRAIRRKNIGEAILISLFFKNNETLAITLPPNSPADIKSHSAWKVFVKEKNLNVVFEAGLTHKFSELVMSARSLITTSITEGFGFSFLEPWTAKKFLWGRKLPEICHDFEKKGIRLDHLYTRLAVPVEWLGKEKLFRTWQACVRKATAMFNIIIDETKIANAFKKVTANDTIDFGLLDESFQKTIISHVLSDQANRDRLIGLNHFLSDPGDVPDKDKLIQNNMNAVLLNYNKTIYRERLVDIYSEVIEDNVYHKIDKKVLLSKFLTLKDFSLLKWCEYAEE
jgi:glycosyltransferase involved in cell wall biosynthesis